MCSSEDECSCLSSDPSVGSIWEFGSSWYFLCYISIMTDEVSEGVTASLMLFWAAHCFAMFCQTFKISLKVLNTVSLEATLKVKLLIYSKCYVNYPEFAAWCCMHFISTKPHETGQLSCKSLKVFIWWIGTSILGNQKFPMVSSHASPTNDCMKGSAQTWEYKIGPNKSQME